MGLISILSIVAILWILTGLVLWWVSLASSKLNPIDEYELRKPSVIIMICLLWPVFLLTK